MDSLAWPDPFFFRADRARSTAGKKGSGHARLGDGAYQWSSLNSGFGRDQIPLFGGIAV